MLNIQYKVKLWVYNHIWPFNRITDLESELEDAVHQRTLAVYRLEDYMRADISNMSIIRIAEVQRQSVRVTAYTGFNLATSTRDPYSDVENIEVVTIMPNVRNLSFDKKSFPTYNTDSETLNHYAHMVANHISRAVWEDVVKEIKNARM